MIDAKPWILIRTNQTKTYDWKKKKRRNEKEEKQVRNTCRRDAEKIRERKSDCWKALSIGGGKQQETQIREKTRNGTRKRQGVK